MNNLTWDIVKTEVTFNNITYKSNIYDVKFYYEQGRHAIFLSNKSENHGYKFFIVKGINYEYSKIQELYEIHKLMFLGGFGVEVYGLCSCYYEGKNHFGLIVEKLYRDLKGDKNTFPLDEFKSFCRSVKGLIKREYYYEEIYGKDWYRMHPQMEFNVGENNIMYNLNGQPKIIDIDPRWQIKK